jgi:hypothetical protein
MQYRLSFALLAISCTSVLAAPVAPVAVEARGTQDASVSAYASYGKYDPPASYQTYPPPKNGYSTYGSYKIKAREASPEAKPDEGYGKYDNYGKYANYGNSYPNQPPATYDNYPPPKDGYSTYGSYKLKTREAKPEAEAEPDNAYGKYGNYGSYPDQPPATYNNYPPPKNGYSTYGSYKKE